MPPFTLEIISVLSIIALLFTLKHLFSVKKQFKQKIKNTVTKLTQNSKEQEQELSLLLNAFDDALVIVDQNEIIKVANRAASELSKGRKLRGKSLVEIFLNEQLISNMRSALESGKPTRSTLFISNGVFGAMGSLATLGTQADFSETACILDIAPLENKGSEQLYRIILKDVTAEHRADQIKKEFVANASHELRTPLSIINGYIENMLEDDIIKEPETIKKFLITMQKHGNRLAKLIEDMLTVSKLESGDSSLLQLSEFSLNDIFNDVIERLQLPIEANQSSIEIEKKSEDIIITGDQFYWEQILFNLAENALKQNSQQPVNLLLRATKDKNSLKIRVSDNGKGISAAHLPYIFNRFYRVEKHHSQNSVKGTGLGLSIVKHAVEAHHGSIEAQSSPGDYTHFIITLPLSSIVH